jgi:hypothetical protein
VSIAVWRVASVAVRIASLDDARPVAAGSGRQF